MFLSPYQRYGSLNTHDCAKSIALILMVCDHIGLYIFPEVEWLRVLGRGSMPIWLFLVGYSSVGKFKKDIIIVAIFLTLYRWWVHDTIFPLHILWTIIITRWVLSWLVSQDNKWWVLLLLIIWAPWSRLLFEYGSVAFLVAYMGYHHRENRRLLIEWGGVWVIYMAIEVGTTSLSAFSMAASALTTACVFVGLYAYRFAPIEQKVPMQSVLKVLSRYSLYIYALHLMLLMAIETQWLI